MTTDFSLVGEPIFLVGSERSGTTLLRLMLCHHPMVSWCFEFEYAVSRMSEQGDFPNLQDYYEWLETNRIFLSTGFKVDRSLNYPQLINSFLIQEQNRDRKPIIGATVHHHFDRLLKIWPNARFIHLIRDGRDVSRSCIAMGWAGNVWTASQRWITAENLWQQVKQQIPAERWVDIKYEDLILQPAHSLNILCEFMGIPYDNAMLDYIDNSTYESPEPKLLQQWRRKLSEKQIQLIESRIGKMLKERGYELSGLPPLNVDSNMIFQLKLQNWWGRLQFRIKRNGFALVLSDFISRRLGFKEWQKQVRLKLNNIETAYLK